ncbi:C4-dicarboxylate ABC transporter permease [candidate division KSB3 bacterium]|uniref:C4-dicarboxylate ABC transporter permease n=1 Tax=candidate division KSB3 bacterium TaxID=2044937 RepID=A0A2G6KCP9_9BACT|nr:MAG: C4-dicarboxylate ABC transporter permease [candidate division KSB3 bacterium]
MEHIFTAISLIVQPYVLMIICISAMYGLFVGAIPGLTATMATALLVPVTFFMDPVPALAAIVTMEAMAIFAGDIPGALVRIPGTPSSAAYVGESYALTRQGKAAFVLGVDVTSAAIGGLIGAGILIFLAPMLAEVAMRFTSFEYFWLACIGLSCAVLVTKGSLLKGMISLLIGLFMTQVGVDITLGYPRFTFGITDFLNGFTFIPAMIGMFGVSEVMRAVSSEDHIYKVGAVQTHKMFSGIGLTLKKYQLNIARSGIIGTFVGVLPGAGADIAAWICYALSKKFSKTPEKFGSGHIEGIVDAGTANNASLGGAWVPALVFGIPGDSITAIVIGVLFMKGLRPGPMIFQQTPEILYAVYIAFILANLILIPFGILAIKAGSQLLRVPRNMLMPAILMFCIVGSFAINNTTFDVGVMLACGILAYFMESNDIPVAPAILGIVLGRLLEDSFMVSMIKSDWNLSVFFQRPVSAVLGVVTLILWLSPFIAAWRRKSHNQS